MSFGEEKIVGYPFESDPNFKSLTSKPNVCSLIFENNVWRSDSIALVSIMYAGSNYRGCTVVYNSCDDHQFALRMANFDTLPKRICQQVTFRGPDPAKC